MPDMNTTILEQDINTIEEIDIEVDKRNNRLIAKDNGRVPANFPEKLLRYAQEKKLEKIMVICHKQNNSTFKSGGFNQRAIIPGYFKGEDAYFLTSFTDGKREIALKEEHEDEIIEKCMQKKSVYKPTKKTHEIRDCTEADIPQMIALFETVFETYPTKIFDTDYLKEIMKERTFFKAVIEDKKIISIAAADMDKKNLNAEITDCATYPGHRGRGLLSILIHNLEEDLKNRGFLTVYSFSRALSTGVNMVFRKLGYSYNGRLINHCDICGKYEDLNIWSKPL